MKKILIYLLLFFFLLNPVVFYTVLEIYKFRMNRELEKIRESGQITMLTIPVPDTTGSFHWIDRNEFSYNGRLYDVVKQVKHNGYTIFYCIHDTMEESLVTSIKHLTGNRFLTFFPDNIVKLYSSGKLPDFFIQVSDYNFPDFTEMVKSIPLPSLTHPPEQSRLFL